MGMIKLDHILASDELTGQAIEILDKAMWVDHLMICQGLFLFNSEHRLIITDPSNKDSNTTDLLSGIFVRGISTSLSGLQNLLRSQTTVKDFGHFQQCLFFFDKFVIAPRIIVQKRNPYWLLGLFSNNRIFQTSRVDLVMKTALAGLREIKIPKQSKNLPGAN